MAFRRGDDSEEAMAGALLIAKFLISVTAFFHGIKRR